MTEFDKDIREKKQIGNSARHKVVGGGRRVGFPSDGLTKKDREKTHLGDYGVRKPPASDAMGEGRV